ncbi:MAG: NAD(P)H-hydrate dehydratase [Symploca sp. SIO2D2]|nr:NAD(P)H-hydrate dehydratase [Symploca sp. SIO2D2]
MGSAFLAACTDPILSCSQAVDLERGLLTDEESEWLAMQKVGTGLGRGIAFEYGLSRFRRDDLNVIAFTGKGHNGGDALLALKELHCLGRVGRATLIFSASESDLKFNTRKALDELRSCLESDLLEYFPDESDAASYVAWLTQSLADIQYDICLDGLLGMQFRPPLREMIAGLIRLANDVLSCRLRVAIDVPSGVGDEQDETTFWADVTFATGVGKAGLFSEDASLAAGSIRYLDIGFFEENSLEQAHARLVKDSVLDPLRERRPSNSEKRKFGHLLVVAGSRGMPGALAMCVASAIRSGVGLVTVFAPESRVAELSARYPEAMWVESPETPEGGLALEGLYLLRRYMDRGSALLLGPGLGREAETIDLVREIVRLWQGSLVLDADALQRSVIEALREGNPARAVLTPHLGEMKRISGYDDLEAARNWARELGSAVVLKGANARIFSDCREFVNTGGNAVLSRGGSGDVLSGIVGGLMAQGRWTAEEAAAMGVYWHGKAADLLAYEYGQTAVRTTQLIDYLGSALKECDVWEMI